MMRSATHRTRTPWPEAQPTPWHTAGHIGPTPLVLSAFLLVLAALLLPGCARKVSDEPLTQTQQFAADVDLTYLGTLAVHSEGRLKSYGSHAESIMRLVAGPRRINNLSHKFTYLDLMMRPRAYEDAEIIYVKNKNIRRMIADTVRESTRADFAPFRGDERVEARLYEFEQRLDRFMRTGLISPLMLKDPAVDHLLGMLRQDLVRTARPVQELETALGVRDERVLRRALRIIPPPGGTFYDQWLTIDEFATSDRPDVDPELRDLILANWQHLQTGWRNLNAPMVNEATAQLAHLVPQVNPGLYKENVGRTGWPWTVEGGNYWTIGEWDWKWTTSIGLGLLSIVLAGVFGVIRRPTLTALALAASASAIIFHGATIWLSNADPLALESWYFNARNMTWVWLFYAISLVPLLLAIVFRWRGAHWAGMGMFLFAFAFHTAALLVRWYVSGRWPNTNMFEAVTTAAWWGGCAAIILEVCTRQSPMRSMFAIGSAAGSMVALMVAYFMPVGLDPNIRNIMPVLHDVWLYIHVNVTIVSYAFIFMAAVTALLYLLYRLIGFMNGGMEPRDEFARMGGAASLIMTTPDGQTYIQKARTSLGQVLDGTTMILVEIAFVFLWTGTVMGAIWADHSWGRPWGWDPKEVFALNTFIVFVALIHVRMKVIDKGFWTAIIALIGAAVMLFNWIAINFVVVGLHSYA